MEKSYRIKKSDEIGKIVHLQNKVYCEFFNIYYQKATSKNRFAVSVSKKYGKAYERNYAKRVIRVLIRPYILKEDIYTDLVIVVKDKFKGTEYSILEDAMDKCYKILLKKIKMEEK